MPLSLSEYGLDELLEELRRRVRLLNSATLQRMREVRLDPPLWIDGELVEALPVVDPHRAEHAVFYARLEGRFEDHPDALEEDNT